MRRRIMAEEELIKISLNGEHFWVEVLGDERYKVCNCLVQNNFTLNDIIDLKGNVLERFGRTAVLQYTVNDDEDIEEIFPEVAKYFENDNGMLIEGLTYGIAGITVPNKITDDEAFEIAKKCPIKCILEFERICNTQE